MIALLNSPVLTTYGTFSYQPIDIVAAKDLIREGYQSYIGHESTCELLSTLLQIPVPLNRTMYYQQPGEQALVIKLVNRLAAGAVIDAVKIIEEGGYQLGLLKMIK